MARPLTLWSTDVRPLVALDWSRRAVHVTFDGIDVDVFGSADVFLDSLNAPHRIAAEATFESWDADVKARVVARLRHEGHELYVFRPIHTARARGDDTKSNAADARIIYGLATEGRLHLYPIPTPNPDHATRRLDLNFEYLGLRLADQKPALAAKAKAILGPYRLQEGDRRLVLGNGTQYSPTMLAVLCFLAERTTSREEFERLLGLHGSGYPSLLRSEIHHHVYRHAHEKRGVTWQQFRRELRRTYQQLKTGLGAASVGVI